MRRVGIHTVLVAAAGPDDVPGETLLPVLGSDQRHRVDLYSNETDDEETGNVTDRPPLATAFIYQPAGLEPP